MKNGCTAPKMRTMYANEAQMMPRCIWCFSAPSESLNFEELKLPVKRAMMVWIMLQPGCSSPPPPYPTPFPRIYLATLTMTSVICRTPAAYITVTPMSDTVTVLLFPMGCPLFLNARMPSPSESRSGRGPVAPSPAAGARRAGAPPGGTTADAYRHRSRATADPAAMLHVEAAPLGVLGDALVGRTLRYGWPDDSPSPPPPGPGRPEV